MTRVLWLVDRPLGLRALNHAVKSNAGTMCGVVSVPDGNTAWWGGSTFNSWAKVHHIAWFDRSALRDAIAATQPELMISVLSTERVPTDIVSSIPCVNLHCAPLPAYRGYNATLWAILNGERQFGTTLHVMTEGCDEGPIVDTSRFDVPSDVTNAELYAMAHDDGFALLGRNLDRVIAKDYPAKPQEGPPRSYARLDLPSRCIEPSSDPETISRYARAFHFPPFEPAFFMIDGRKIYLSVAR